MRTHVKTGRTSFANSLLLLVAVAGMVKVDLPERDPVSGHDHKSLYRIALVFDAAPPLSSFPVSFVSEVIHRNDIATAYAFRPHFRSTCFGVSSLVVQETGTVNNRPVYVSHNHTRLFNIPHQNSDEDNAFISRVDVA